MWNSTAWCFFTISKLHCSSDSWLYKVLCDTVGACLHVFGSYYGVHHLCGSARSLWSIHHQRLVISIPKSAVCKYSKWMWCDLASMGFLTFLTFLPKKWKQERDTATNILKICHPLAPRVVSSPELKATHENMHHLFPGVDNSWPNNNSRLQVS